MAWCMNPECGKQNLRKSQVEFDEEARMVLCQGCYALRHPGWTPEVEQPVVLYPPPPPPPPQWEYALSLSSKDGFRAQVGYGSTMLSFHAPPQELKRVFGFQLEEHQP